MHHFCAPAFHGAVLSQHGHSDMECLGEHVDVWDKDYGVIINECLCCVSLSLLTLLSDRGSCSRTELFLLHFKKLAAESKPAEG